MLIQRSFLNLSRSFFGNEARAFRLLSSKTDGGESWIRSLMHRKEVEQQSHILSTSPCIYELQVHEVKPQFVSDYLQEFEHFLGFLPKTDSKAEIVGSWTCEIGHQDTAYHLWKYPGGYPCLGEHTEVCRSNKDIIDYKQKRNSMLCSRKNQVCLPFSYWPEPVACRTGSNLYELRSYTLRPGTMIEWANHWAQGFRLRSKSMDAVAGLFSHIGEMHVVHHFWAYSSLEARKKLRDLTWQEPGWNTCVMRTVPLIRSMHSSILRPTSFSPLQ